MTPATAMWTSDMPSLGSAVVAIGVFDGVHIGHQALLREAVADARERGALAVAVTFDRDPDQVVSRETAAPQLLTLADKLRFMAETGIDTTLVIPFTADLAETAPEVFVESVLLRAVDPVAIHVGSDFRFGRMATGDVVTLQRAGVQFGFEVVPHSLVSAEGSAVTSTRIRSFVASGDVAGAAELLGRPTRVSGTVHRGRGEGATLGFPTANVVPVEFAAVPASGVYAGRVVVPDDTEWAAAISVGTPPMFPEARDYLEAHIIDFDGDLYDAPLTIEFMQRLRDQRSYPSLDALKRAIAADVERALEIAGFETGEAQDEPSREDAESSVGSWEADPVGAVRNWLWPGAGDDEDMGELESGEPVVDDPRALEAAEQAAMDAPSPFEVEATGDWVELFSRLTIPGGPGAAPRASEIVAPLEATGIPFAWSPYPPTERPTSLPAGGVYPAAFDVLVPQDRVEEARDAVVGSGSPYAADLTADADPSAIASLEQQAPDRDDPAALEAAEQAVREIRPRHAPGKHADDEWVVLLGDMHFDSERFRAIDGALASAGIDHVWEPYPPQEAPLLRLGIWDTERFSVSVFEGDLEAARDVLAGLREDD